MLSFPRKRESRIIKIWIPNQVGDDIGVVFGDDSGVVFRDDSYYGSSIKDFKDESLCGFRE